MELGHIAVTREIEIASAHDNSGPTSPWPKHEAGRPDSDASTRHLQHINVGKNYEAPWLDDESPPSTATGSTK